ncbi:MAG: redox-sensing transcriptional repressor Rex [Chloroflexi bacterium]|nr:redox-sensing transcriptional repressor Rex [Chloroflexota bacterium]
MPPAGIPEIVIDRLPLYVRALALLATNGQEIISSKELGEELGVTPAQIRKDLSYFGRFGKQGSGYNVAQLLDELREVLGLTQRWSMALLGVGRLGRAILSYGGFGSQQLHVAKAFDSDPAVIGTEIGGVVVEDVKNVAASLKALPVEIAIVAVPPSAAQPVIDELVAAGVRAILNYAPIAVRVPPGVRCRNVDPVVYLHAMTYYLKSDTRGSSDATALSREEAGHAFEL